MTLIFASTEDCNQALSFLNEQGCEDLFRFAGEDEFFDPLQTEEPSIVFDGNTLQYYPGWLAFAPALVLPPVTFAENLLPVYLSFLIGEPDAFFEHPEIPEEEKFAHAAFFKMQFGLPFREAELPEARGFANLMNRALIMLYGQFSDFSPHTEDVISLLNKAFEAADSKLRKARAVFEILNAFADLGQVDSAEIFSRAITETDDYSQELKDKISVLLFRLWVQESDRAEGGFEFEQKAWLLFKKLERRVMNKRDVFHAFFFRDAAETAARRAFFSESLSLLNIALTIFENEELAPLAADARYRKGVIFQNWAAKGEPQFYGKSLESFRKAQAELSELLDNNRQAELLQRIGIVMTEMPADPKKKPLYFAEAFKNFEEALQKAENLYLEAQIQSNFAASLVKAADKQKGVGGLEKASELCRKALEVRTPEMPEERCLTLITLTEALIPQEGRNNIEDLEALLSEAERLTNIREFKNQIGEIRKTLHAEVSS